MDLPTTTNQPSAENKSSSESLFINTTIKQPHPLFISQLYTTGKYTDLIIKCQGKEFKVHRAIVCSQSKPLAAALDHGFKEATDGVFDFEEDEPEIVEYMIRFLYDDLYSVSKQQKHPDTATWGGNATSVMPDGTSLTGDSASTSDPPFDFTTRSFRAPANSDTSGLEKLFGSASPAAQALFPSSNGASIFGPPQAPRDSGRNIFSYVPQPGEKPSLFSLYRDVSPHATPAPATGNMFRPVPPTTTHAATPRSISSLFGPVVPVNTPTPTTATASSTQNLFGGPTANTSGNNIEVAKTPIQVSKGKFNWSGRGSLFGGSATYGQSSENIELQAEDLIKHAKVYIMAEKYDIQPLKRLARQRYSSVADNYWNSRCFVQSIELIFDGTPDISEGDDLRKAVLEVASRYMKQLLAREDFAQMCQERGDIGFAILQWSSWSM
ncbi:putative btb poz domain protein [Botrytis fragariae]|uniref:Putative btb poz domain protein n=1 Tax=Botrytis fragariae TaxID=1964551 RepID=A0A8H6AP37_9HELO|nr:putative btb poz domain protein [Botrytis fragariae]KAF5870921.1 putative btb poz domain protein [Botrytis fragariae]